MEEVTAQSQSQPNKQGVSWKNVLIGAVIGSVFVGIGALAFYLVQGRTEDKTSTQITTPKIVINSPKAATSSAMKNLTNWDTYKSGNFSFSIDNPNNWVAYYYTGLREDVSQPVERLVINRLQNESLNNGKPRIEIWGFFQGGFCDGPGGSEKHCTTEDYFVSGVSGKKYTGINNKDFVVYYFPSKKVTVFTYAEGKKELIDKMMVTFKF